jgi:hypothetical protein
MKENLATATFKEKVFDFTKNEEWNCSRRSQA